MVPSPSFPSSPSFATSIVHDGEYFALMATLSYAGKTVGRHTVFALGPDEGVDAWRCDDLIENLAPHVMRGVAAKLIPVTLTDLLPPLLAETGKSWVHTVHWSPQTRPDGTRYTLGETAAHLTPIYLSCGYERVPGSLSLRRRFEP